MSYCNGVLPFLAGLATIASGCSSGVSGVYLALLEHSSEVECDVEIDENYNDDEDQDNDDFDSDWTLTSTNDASPGAFYFELVALNGGSYAINYLGTLAVGEESSSGSWHFTWEDYSDALESQEHQDGYEYIEHTYTATTTNFEISQAKEGFLSGTVSGATVDTMGWEESDEWDPDEQGIFTTQVPSDDYLYDEDGFGVKSYPDDEDCSDNNCELEITETCSMSSPFTAYKTEGDPSGDYMIPGNTAGM